ncbi:MULTISPECIES: K(+)-transporting ATPase subunit C [Bacillus cereus group]|uniref:Potassium-transporting ATPase KdpC subunit n=1 Tax=Bacillus cereus TaxID=1396 RepID=A0AA44TD46_BACCE|nr:MULTISPECIES: K(+)-transporting ATPase subunit C [Bacillus cereus group]EEL52029.1 Potassium-transporting ATPase C chain [Bacillus cereus Rock3-44]PFA25614.1 K(+)-transporting ATPase subunit C [Bacillus cereus]PFN08579.1 K(+)-transporting ATPase subunit C [Bacillus cereus]PFO77897.1 K(+)-transporting ATPase subunit C [Bacillus cereus]PFR27088.1 K(+)-transporting ATPase subunit C [Bacillus cereus]
MTEKQSFLGPVVRLTGVLVVLCGLIYPAAVTGVAQVTMKDNAEGSLIYDKGEVIGSKLIGQEFKSAKYFQGRVSSIEYKAEGSGSNNYAPSNPELLQRTEKSIEKWKEDNPSVPVTEVPMDLVTNSASGLDPHISPKSAYAQVDRVAKETKISKDKLKDMIASHTEGRALGLYGEERVNVLKLNIEVQKLTK